MLESGVALLPEDRKKEGLVMTLDVEQNATLASLGSIATRGVLNFGRQRDLASRFINDLSIRTSSPKALVRDLSGGNQQKVVLSKYLARAPRLLIFDEPTRGIDVGAKAEIYALVNRLTSEGHGILLISSELPELLRMSDRVVVLSRGRIMGRFDRPATEQEVLEAMFEQAEHPAVA
jgi:ABC-type sugar transport system ATPase subunit